MDAAACIGCGACVAACPNGSAALFTAAKLTHLGLVPQGRPERESRAAAMVKTGDREGFGACSNVGECEQACPKSIPAGLIRRMNRDALVGVLRSRRSG
jgi:succinate dehydrogenase / fumarate reductase iron-sulfur subunit